MRVFFFIFLICSSGAVFSQAIQGLVNYEIVFGEDPRLLLRESDAQRVRNAQKLTGEISFNLYFNSKESFFEIAQQPVDHRYFSDLFFLDDTYSEYSYYTNLETQEYSYSFRNNFKRKTYTLTAEADYEWEIKGDTKVIHGMTVYKAEGITHQGDKIEAWFAPEIPVSTGPANFIGLPGLILEFQKDYTKYVARRIEFTDKYNKQIKKVIKGHEIDRKTLEEIENEEFEYFMNLHK